MLKNLFRQLDQLGVAHCHHLRRDRLVRHLGLQELDQLVLVALRRDLQRVLLDQLMDLVELVYLLEAFVFSLFMLITFT